MQCITSKSTRTDSRQGGREDHDKNGEGRKEEGRKEGRKKEGRKEAKAQSLNGRGKICTERERETGRETRDAVSGPAQSALKSASMSSVLCTLYWTRSSISRSLLSRLSRSLQLTVKTSRKAVGDDHLTASSDGHVWSRVVTGSHVNRRGRASEYECDLPGLDKRMRSVCRMQALVKARCGSVLTRDYRVRDRERTTTDSGRGAEASHLQSQGTIGSSIFHQGYRYMQSKKKKKVHQSPDASPKDDKKTQNTAREKKGTETNEERKKKKKKASQSSQKKSNGHQVSSFTYIYTNGRLGRTAYVGMATLIRQ